MSQENQEEYNYSILFQALKQAKEEQPLLSGPDFLLVREVSDSIDVLNQIVHQDPPQHSLVYTRS